MHLTLFHNPTAGSGDNAKDEIIALLEQCGHTVQYQASDADEIEAALEQPSEAVVVVGGDGTVGQVLPKLVGREVVVGLLPGGTGNNIARTLNLNGEWRETVAAWDLSQTRPFSVGVVQGLGNEIHFLEAVGCGLFPALVQQAQAEKDQHTLNTPEEELAFVLHLLQDLATRHPPSPYRISFDGQDFSGEYLLVEAMNIRSLGPNLDLAPLADPGDGHLNLVLLTPEDRLGLVQYVKERLAGKTPLPDWKVIRGQKLELEWTDAPAHVDDTVLEVTSGHLTISFPDPPVRIFK